MIDLALVRWLLFDLTLIPADSHSSSSFSLFLSRSLIRWLLFDLSMWWPATCCHVIGVYVATGHVLIGVGQH